VRIPILAVACLSAACSRAPESPATATTAAAPPKITQFYASPAEVPRGEKTLLCYGVENAKTVWLSPPRREVSAALSRCIDVEPAAATTYTLTAEGDGGSAKQDVTVTIGAAKPGSVKIKEVRVTSLSIKKGEAVSICYAVSNAASVRIEPATTPSGRDPHCGIAHPDRTTTYTVTATGAGGDRDQERVTVQVH
jgi:hypothetical protein